MDNIKTKNVKGYYRLTRKILKMNVLSVKDASHLAIMFADAAEQCSPKNKSIDELYSKLLTLSVKNSR